MDHILNLLNQWLAITSAHPLTVGSTFCRLKAVCLNRFGFSKLTNDLDNIRLGFQRRKNAINRFFSIKTVCLINTPFYFATRPLHIPPETPVPPYGDPGSLSRMSWPTIQPVSLCPNYDLPVATPRPKSLSLITG